MAVNEEPRIFFAIGPQEVQVINNILWSKVTFITYIDIPGGALLERVSVYWHQLCNLSTGCCLPCTNCNPSCLNPSLLPVNTPPSPVNVEDIE